MEHESDENKVSNLSIYENFFAVNSRLARPCVLVFVTGQIYRNYRICLGRDLFSEA